MAKRATNGGKRKGKGPPDPSDIKAFRAWLAGKPPSWSIAIVMRMALRVLPFAYGGKNSAAILLAFLRATAIARFAAMYPEYVSAALPAASMAYDAAYDIADTLRNIPPRGRWAAMLTAANAAHAAHRAVYRQTKTNSAASAAGAAVERIFETPFDADTATAILAAVMHDAEQLHAGVLTAQRLAVAKLWPKVEPRFYNTGWQRIKSDLSLSEDWWTWFEWSRGVDEGPTHRWAANEAWHAAFTDIRRKYPWNDKLPWDQGGQAVNTAIAVRLKMLLPVSSESEEEKQGKGESARSPRTTSERIAKLAELASPQPSINLKGQLDARSNQPFDVPEDGDDLAELPFQQRNLIKNLSRNLPKNAPQHLKDFLKSYDDELKARGTQPMLGVLKDNAEIIAADVAAPRAEDEWLEAGLRKAFELFAKNHKRIVDHYPLDPKREEAYAATEVDEGRVTKQTLEAPLAELAAKTGEAQEAGAVTPEFKLAVDGLHEISIVIATLPPRRTPDIELPPDAVVPITAKKRFVLRVTGFLRKAVDQVDDLNFGRTANALQIGEALRQALEKFLPFIR